MIQFNHNYLKIEVSKVNDMLISLVISFALLVIGGIIWVIIEGIVHISKKTSNR